MLGAHRAWRIAAAFRPGNLGLLDMKQLELAKALAVRPRLLLLDEIAGGLTEAETETLSPPSGSSTPAASRSSG